MLGRQLLQLQIKLDARELLDRSIQRMVLAKRGNQGGNRFHPITPKRAKIKGKWRPQERHIELEMDDCLGTPPGQACNRNVTYRSSIGKATSTGHIKT